MEPYLKTHNQNLSTYITCYLQSNGESDEILLENIKEQMETMLTSGVIKEIIFSYPLTIVQLLVVMNEIDLMEKHKKIDNILKIMYADDTERKRNLMQLLGYCIKGSSTLRNMQDPNKFETFMNILNYTI